MLKLFVVVDSQGVIVNLKEIKQPISASTQREAAACVASAYGNPFEPAAEVLEDMGVRVVEQVELPLYNPKPPHHHNAVGDTSKAAAHSIIASSSSLRMTIHRAIVSAARGLTCDEVEVKLSLSHQTASARVYELHKGLFIEDSKQRRATRSGRKAIVWVNHHAR